MERWIDDAAGIVEIVVKGLGGKMTTTFADVKDIKRCYLSCYVTELTVVRLENINKHTTAELLQVVTLTGDIKTVGTCLTRFADVIDQAFGDSLKSWFDCLGVLLDDFNDASASVTTPLPLSLFTITDAPMSASPLRASLICPVISPCANA